jgi:hypothetical protein
MAFIMRITRFSFPGIIFALYRSKSSGCKVRRWLPPKAARASCARSSPWDPVVTTMSSFGIDVFNLLRGYELVGIDRVDPGFFAASR